MSTSAGRHGAWSRVKRLFHPAPSHHKAQVRRSEWWVPARRRCKTLFSRGHRPSAWPCCGKALLGRTQALLVTFALSIRDGSRLTRRRVPRHPLHPRAFALGRRFGGRGLGARLPTAAAGARKASGLEGGNTLWSVTMGSPNSGLLGMGWSKCVGATMGKALPARVRLGAAGGQRGCGADGSHHKQVGIRGFPFRPRRSLIRQHARLGRCGLWRSQALRCGLLAIPCCLPGASADGGTAHTPPAQM